MHDATDISFDRKVIELREFEAEIVRHFEAGRIRGPVHLSHGNEEELIRIFENVGPRDWVFSTWRNHYHALLKGIPKERVEGEILSGRSINLNSSEHRFFTSAIVGGILPIAVGVADGLKRQLTDFDRESTKEKVWCFVGDMAASTGSFKDALIFSENLNLPITFVVEDNGLSTNSPTKECWGGETRVPKSAKVIHYKYKRHYPHVGIGRRIHF